MTLPVEFGWGTIREGNGIARAANILPQIESFRPTTEPVTVSYQTTLTVLLGNWTDNKLIHLAGRNSQGPMNSGPLGLPGTDSRGGSPPHEDRPCGLEQLLLAGQAIQTHAHAGLDPGFCWRRCRPQAREEPFDAASPRHKALDPGGGHPEHRWQPAEADGSRSVSSDPPKQDGASP